MCTAVRARLPPTWLRADSHHWRAWRSGHASHHPTRSCCTAFTRARIPPGSYRRHICATRTAPIGAPLALLYHVPCAPMVLYPLGLVNFQLGVEPALGGKAACGRLLCVRVCGYVHVCGCVAEAHSKLPLTKLSLKAFTQSFHSKLRSDDHQLFHAMSPTVSMTATSTNIGVKSRPLASSSQPVKYWPDAPATTAKTDVPP